MALRKTWWPRTTQPISGSLLSSGVTWSLLRTQGPASSETNVHVSPTTFCSKPLYCYFWQHFFLKYFFSCSKIFPGKQIIEEYMGCYITRTVILGHQVVKGVPAQSDVGYACQSHRGSALSNGHRWQFWALPSVPWHSCIAAISGPPMVWSAKHSARQ